MTTYTVAVMLPEICQHDYITGSLLEAYREFRRVQAKGWPVLLLGSYPEPEGSQVEEITQVLMRANL